MQAAITQEALRRYTAGTADAAEAAAVRVWLREPAHQLLAQVWMREHWDSLDTAPAAPLSAADEPDYEALLSALHQRLSPAFGAVDTDTDDETDSPAPIRWRYWAAAATLAATVGAGGLWWQQHTPAPDLRVATTYGQTRTVHLPDGSTVKLNGHSAMRYNPGRTAGAPREVWLDGEAYFAVQHQPNDQPFIVHTTAGFQVEVLGTKFTVSRRAEQARVVLLSGKVRVDFADSTRPDVLMKPGELVETQDAHPAAVVHKTVRPEAYAGWKDDLLVLDETTIAELADRLHETYGLEVVVATPGLRARRVTGTIPIGDLNTLLQALQETFQLTIERQPNRLTFSETAVPSVRP